jgi:hypothetical protein
VAKMSPVPGATKPGLERLKCAANHRRWLARAGLQAAQRKNRRPGRCGKETKLSTKFFGQASDGAPSGAARDDAAVADYLDGLKAGPTGFSGLPVIA